MSAGFREWLIRLVLITLSTLVSLVIAEVAVRLFHPISDGRDNVTLDGIPIKSWFEPGSVYRQVSNEYDARTTITDKAHRVPGTSGNPDVVFIGDSFTYGWGIADEDTFVSVYCMRTGRACVNLGAPGNGTAKQLDRLEQFLDTYQWRPKEVKLIFFGMSSAWSSGNDFVDNYDERELANLRFRAAARVPGDASVLAAAAGSTTPTDRPARIGLAERVIGLQSWILGHSHLARLVKFYWGPLVKSLLVASPGEERFAQALHYTRLSLERLDSMSRARGFEYRIYLIVPVHDLLRRTHTQTLDTLDGVAPKRVISTAPLLVDDPASYYFAYDGHINARASRKIGEFLAESDSGTRADR